MKIFVRLLVFTFLFSYVSSYAQNAIEGVVADSTTQESLVGASVLLVGTAMGSAVNIEGEYKISNIPDGSYKLRVSYIGYAQKTVDVKVRGGQTLQLFIQMSPEMIEGKMMTITAQAAGQVAAINQQLSSNTIVNVVSEQKIQEMPDANAAEALGRLPGVSVQRSGGEANKIVLRGLSDKFSTFTVDGVRIAGTEADSRGMDLSTISQGSLAGIELFKALTSDKDADAIAGSINLVTKKAPTERLIRLDSKGAYGKMDNTVNQYDFSLRYGERFFDNMLGVQVTGNVEQRNRSKEDMSVSYTQSKKNNTDWEIVDFSPRYTNEIRQRQGGGLILDYETPDGGTIKFSNIYNKTSRDYADNSRNYPIDGSEIIYDTRIRKQDISTFNSSLTGDNFLLGFKVNWALSFAESVGEFPYDYDMQFTEPSETDASGKVTAGMYNVPSSVVKGPIESIIPYAVNNFGKAYAFGALYRKEKNLDKEKTAFLNLTKEYSLSSDLTGILKFGGKYRIRDRYRNLGSVVAPYYNLPFMEYTKLADGSIVKKNFAGTRFQNLTLLGNKIIASNFIDNPATERSIYDQYRLYPIMNRSAIEEWWNLNQNGVDANGKPEYVFDQESEALHYDITERVSSLYAMNTLNIGREITFIAGIRVETEDNNYYSKMAPKGLSGWPAPGGTVIDTSSAHTESVVLPNFQLLLKPTEYLSIRLAAYKALARPDFNYRLENFVPRGSTTFYSGDNLTVGNPGLKAAKAWNFEINTSIYSNDIGLFSVSIFYKDITDMIRYINGAQVIGQKILDSLGINYKNPFSTSTKYGLYYPYNSSQPTKVWGFEIEHQANMNFLPGYLKNITLSYNLSIVRSESYTPFSYFKSTGSFPKITTTAVLVEVKRQLEGQPEFYGNVAFGYDIGGFSGRLSVFYQGEYNLIFSPDSRADVIQKAFTKVDLALKQQVTNYLSVMLNINNLTNTEEGTTLVNRVQNWSLFRSSERYGLTADLGVRISL